MTSTGSTLPTVGKSHNAPTSFSYGVQPNRRVLDKHFIAQLVSEPVLEFAISAGAKQGDNMLGTLLAVDVKTVSKKILHLVIKSVLPMTGVIDSGTLIDSKFMAELKAYPKEVFFYEKVRPIMNQAVKSFNPGPVYYSSFIDKECGGLYDYIALEDLRPSGYKMADKFKSLSFEQMSAVLKELAMFHGISYCLLKKEGSVLRKLTEDPNGFLNKHGWTKDLVENGDMSTLFNGVLSKMFQIIRENGQAEEANKLEKYTETGHDILIGLFDQIKKETNEKYFPVLIHGDLWVNNIMFKFYADGKTIEDLKFIDFQECRLGTIYEDLHYLFFTSTTAKFRKDHLKSCLQVYFQEFSRVVSSQLQEKYELPFGFTEESLLSTFLENLEYGYLYGIAAIPFQIGIKPPPQSPMTPLEININSLNNAHQGESVNDNCIDGSTQDNQKYIDDMVLDLEEAARNSPVAIQRIKDIVHEMVENGVIS